MKPSHTRRMIPAILVVGALTLASACGPDARQKAIQTSVVSLNAARDGFVKWDEHKQAGIVADATSLEQGKAALAAYRAKRASIVEGFTVAYAALALAAVDDDMARLTEAINAATAVYKLIKGLTGKESSGP